MQQRALWTFHGKIENGADISAIAVLENGQFVAIAGDEGATVQILQRRSPGEYETFNEIDLTGQLKKGENEFDIEGLAYSRGRIYVLGSHSKKRPLLDPSLSQNTNRKRLFQRDNQPGRQGLYEIDYQGNGQFAKKVKPCDLIEAIQASSVLAPFLEIPSKENGIDLEGLAAQGDDLVVGFRGPILREGWVPILKLDFDKPEKAKTLFVQLGGRGVRDLLQTAEGLLILAGPMRDEPLAYAVYFWNGNDAIAGHDRRADDVPILLGEVPLPHVGAKPEGLGLVEEGVGYFDVVLVCDSSPNGSPTVFRVAKPLPRKS
ncbi:DUF3616 domain-containing protein [Bremerella cremea]|uniref:DUF3616 domain-containing protein n=1 Tax=Bremerella cremea TaxID=1031537 RepID=UPI0031F1087A